VASHAGVSYHPSDCDMTESEASDLQAKGWHGENLQAQDLAAEGVAQAHRVIRPWFLFHFVLSRRLALVHTIFLFETYGMESNFEDLSHDHTSLDVSNSSLAPSLSLVMPLVF
jgi:hypothetical protein